MFNNLINRHATDSGWQKIPWHDPKFSQRMLAEHLSQAHDLASRKFATIDRHVRWIHNKILNSRSVNLLDLGWYPTLLPTISALRCPTPSR